jgi:hypothetical protein
MSSGKPEHAGAVRDGGLRADCANCFGLCCVAPAFSASSDFAIDKAAGRACPNLQPAFGCGIHDNLRQAGFPGCTVYDCFGAGQQVAQVAFGGRDWRQAPETAKRMFEVFPIMRQLHELLWYLTEALTLPRARPLHGELRVALEATELLTRHSPVRRWTRASRCWWSRAARWRACSRSPPPAVRRSRTRPSVWLVAVVIGAGVARTGSALATTD